MFKPGDVCKTVLRPNDTILRGTTWAPDCIVTIDKVERDEETDEGYGTLYEVILVTGRNRWGEEITPGFTQYIYEYNLVLLSQLKAISGFAKFQKTISDQQHNCFKEQSSDA